MSLALTLAGARAFGQGTPDVRVEFFGAERGYAVGAENVTLLCVVRNIGTGALPEKTLRLRCYAMSGLDYTSGDTMPILPTLAPNQALSFRWRLAPNGNRVPRVAAAILESLGTAPAGNATTTPAGNTNGPRAEPSGSGLTGGTPRVALTVVPQLDAAPRLGVPGVAPNGSPQATATGDDAWIANDTLSLRIVTAERRLPLLFVSGRAGTEWRALGTGVTLGGARAAEEGQTPWWETFHLRQAKARAEKDLATLTLTGTLGTRWRAEIVLTAIRNTVAIAGRLRLTALRPLRCYGVELPRLLVAGEDKNAPAAKADGSPLPVGSEDAILADTPRVAAARRNGITFGLTWPSTPALTGWRWEREPAGDSSFALALGAAWTGDERGDVILPGATVEFPFRLFAFSPSDTLRDALRFVLP